MSPWWYRASTIGFGVMGACAVVDRWTLARLGLGGPYTPFMMAVAYTLIVALLFVYERQQARLVHVARETVDTMADCMKLYERRLKAYELVAPSLAEKFRACEVADNTAKHSWESIGVGRRACKECGRVETL